MMIHGSSVAWKGGDGRWSAVLLRGKSGSGKSDLCFRLMDAGGALIADDQVALELRLGKIMAAAPEAIHGLIEVRGLGLLKYPVAPLSQLCLIVDLLPREEVPRIPEWETVNILGVAVACLRLHAFDASTPAKIVKAIDLVYHPELLVK